MKGNLGTTLAVVTLLYVLVFFGPKKFTDWQVDHTRRMAEVKASIRQLDEAKAGPKIKKFTITSEWTKNLHEVFKLQNGESLDWVLDNSPGLKLQAMVNEKDIISLGEDTATNHVSGFSLRIRVDPNHHEIGTWGMIRAWKHTVD